MDRNGCFLDSKWTVNKNDFGAETVSVAETTPPQSFLARVPQRAATEASHQTPSWPVRPGPETTGTVHPWIC
jgi:hypothetical protein